MMNKKENNVVSVIVPLPLAEEYDYFTKESLKKGDIVSVPFGKKNLDAIVFKTKDKSLVPLDKIKEINALLAEKIIPEKTMNFIRWVADYTLTPLGAVAKMVLPVKDVFKSVRITKNTKPILFEEPVLNFSSVILSSEQKEASDKLTAKIGNGFSVSLLFGVTGSGKTEVYFEAIEKALQNGGQVLVLLPEIMLTGQWLERFKRRFKVSPALWHSALTPRQRRETWLAVNNGKAKVLVGARSALFLPFKNLALIIVDEEHDQSYKQEEGVIYQARDMAVARAKMEEIPAILSSATPSLETMANANEGKYDKITLPIRYKGASLPDVHIIDMRANPPEKEEGEASWISPVLLKEIEENIARKEQTLLFLNRRGYAPLMLCRNCGFRIQCPNCSSWLVEHRKAKRLICHHCGHSAPIPNLCPECQEAESMVSCGPGTERLFEEVQKRFKNAKVVMVNSDTLNNSEEAESLIKRICSLDVDIIVGTQILAKGHHFPSLTLVGVIDADLGLEGGDMRAGEKTFQLISQVAGRAGREDKKGRAFLQTYAPQNGVLKALITGDMTEFTKAETFSRKMLGLPPFGRLAGLIISSEKQDEAYKTAREIAKKAPPSQMNVEVLGPAPAPIALLRGKYRFRLLIKSPKNVNLTAIIKEWLTKVKIPYNVKVQVDIDPYSFM